MPDPTLAAQLRAAAQEAREQDPEAPAQPPPGLQVWLSPELAEAIAGLLEAEQRLMPRDLVDLQDLRELRAVLDAAEALVQ